MLGGDEVIDCLIAGVVVVVLVILVLVVKCLLFGGVYIKKRAGAD